METARSEMKRKEMEVKGSIGKGREDDGKERNLVQL